MRWLFRFCGALLFVVSSATSYAEDCTAPKSRDELKLLVSNLGYEVAEEGNLLKISVNNKYNYPVYFSQLPDKSFAMFTVLETVPEDKYGRMPAIKILRFNDAHLNYLSLNKHGDDLRFVLQNVIASTSATPQTVRAAITQLIDDANASDMLWSPGKWQ